MLRFKIIIENYFDLIFYPFFLIFPGMKHGKKGVKIIFLQMKFKTVSEKYI